MAAERGATVDLEGFETRDAASSESADRRQRAVSASPAPTRCRRPASSATTSSKPTPPSCASGSTARSRSSAGEKPARCCSTCRRSTRRLAARWATPGRCRGPADSGLVRDTQPVAGSDARAHDVLIEEGELRPGQPVHAHGRRDPSRPDRAPSQRHPPAQPRPSRGSRRRRRPARLVRRAGPHDLRLLLLEARSPPRSWPRSSIASTTGSGATLSVPSR